MTASIPTRDLILTGPEAKRFWTRVTVPETHSDCMDWIGSSGTSGYGKFGLKRGGRWGMYYPHRISAVFSRGPFSRHLLVDHICHNRMCVNPLHLRLVNAKQNAENTSVQSRSKSGIRGVSWSVEMNKWWAAARHEGAHYSAGYFDSLTAAEEAVVALRLELHSHSDVQSRLGPSPVVYGCVGCHTADALMGGDYCQDCANRNRRHAAETRADITMSRRNRWAAL